MSSDQPGISFIYPNDCGNSPKTVRLKEIFQSLIEGNLEIFIESIEEEVQWNLIGDRQIKGKENVVHKIKSFSLEQLNTLTLKTIITHGKLGSVSGTVKLEDTNEIDFSTTFLFKSAGSKSKIIEIDSYIIGINRS
ncbi:hypothetical protein NSQ54_08360 [Alkalihalobacillus sp. FSL W8-0930]